MSDREALTSATRIVIKVGTRLVSAEKAGLDLEFLDGLARQVARLHQRDRQALLVTSGAVHLGRRELGLGGNSEDITVRQAAAAVGQPGLMRYYAEAFAAHGMLTAQILKPAISSIARATFV